MKNQACEPCAKRKVRCDRGTPCSHCKRRKEDNCVYVEHPPERNSTSKRRISELEAKVRSLGGDPQSVTATKKQRPNPSPPASQSPLQQSQRQDSASHNSATPGPVVYEEDGQTYYHESGAWKGWLGKDHTISRGHNISLRPHSSTQSSPDALASILQSQPRTYLPIHHPSPQDAAILWHTFRHRVYPVLRILWSWVLDELQSATASLEKRKLMSNAQHALVFALYLVSVVSLSEDECMSELHRPKATLLKEFQTPCEEALGQANILNVADVTVIKAMTVYLTAGIDRLSTQSLWSLMGIVLRNAERLGLHRDATVLGFAPHDVEDRHRLWWHLQHLDLALSVRSGTTSLSLMASWDTRMPLNIEDEDLEKNDQKSPAERRGLTSISYCLFTYWVIDQQRKAFNSSKESFTLSWQMNTSLSNETKQSLVDRLEEDVNSKFLQFCDPIKPVDILLQLVARAVVCGMRERTLHSVAFNAETGEIIEDNRNALLDACMRSLEYNIAIHSQPLISHFRWLTSGFFPWHAFMCVIVEASQQTSTTVIRKIWKLLTDLYAANTTLLDLSEDRRRLQAARLVVAAWKANRSKPDVASSVTTPSFVHDLETRLTGSEVNANASQSQLNQAVPAPEPFTSDSLLTESDVNAITDFEFAFADIDWEFWNSMG